MRRRCWRKTRTPHLGCGEEKSMVFHWFLLFFQNPSGTKESVGNTSQTLPRRSKGSPRLSQDPPKTPKMAPRHRQDAFKTPPNAPRNTQSTPQTYPRGAKTAQDTPGLPKDVPSPRPLQISIFEGAGETKNEHAFNVPKHQSIQISKHPNGDGGMRGAFE